MWRCGWEAVWRLLSVLTHYEGRCWMSALLSGRERYACACRLTRQTPTLLHTLHRDVATSLADLFSERLPPAANSSGGAWAGPGARGAALGPPPHRPGYCVLRGAGVLLLSLASLEVIQAGLLHAA